MIFSIFSQFYEGYYGEIEKDIISEEIEKAFDTKTIKEELDKAKMLISKKFE